MRQYPIKRTRRRTCPCCRKRFRPAKRHAHNQHWCSVPACQAARRRYSRRLWWLRNRHLYLVQEHERKRPKRPKRFKAPPQLVILVKIMTIQAGTCRFRLEMNGRECAGKGIVVRKQVSAVEWVVKHLRAVLLRVIRLVSPNCYTGPRNQTGKVPTRVRPSPKPRRKDAPCREQTKKRKPSRKSRASPA